MGLRLRLRFVIAMMVAALVAITVAPAGASPGTPPDPVDGPAADDHQHGEVTGHLPASSRNVELVGRVDLTTAEGGIADVAAFGNFAYLNAWGPECVSRGG